MHPLLESLARSWNQAGVRWAFLRTPHDPEAPTGDVDLLVHPADAENARVGLAEAGFVRLPARGYGSDAFFLGYHAGRNSWVWLHLAQQVTFGRYQQVRTEAAGACLARRERWGDHGWTLCPDDAFWTLMLHCLADKGKIAEKHRARLQELATSATVDGPLPRVAAGIVVSPGDQTGWVIQAARDGEWAALEAVAQTMQLPRQPLRTALIRTRRTATRLRDARRRGLVVALMGPDGAGKSTLARGIRSSFFFPSTSVYMGVGPGLIQEIARQLKPFHRPPFTYFGFVSTLWLRYLTGQLHRWRGKLVVFDRYTYDALLPMPGGVSRLKGAALRVQARVCPPPDLLLVLDVPGEVMFSRKGEFSPEHLEAQRQTLLSLQDRLPRVEVLDGTLPRETVLAEAVQRIWSRYADRLKEAG